MDKLDKLKTFFAPADRSSKEDVLSQKNFVEKFLFSSPAFRGLFDSVPDSVVILNENRQIVFANASMLKVLGLDSDAKILGLRPGEAVNCCHSDEMPGGCGTSEACQTCGAVMAILAAQKGETRIGECRILQHGGNTLEFNVNAAPVDIMGKKYTLFAVVDISNEKRRRVLERVFFHDILNKSGALLSYAELLKDMESDKPQEHAKRLYVIAERLIDEIQAQRQLLAAENDELAVSFKDINAKDIALGVILAYELHSIAKGKNIVLSGDSESVFIKSDQSVLSRIVGNMVKNALEASEMGQTVTVTCKQQGDNVIFSVHNSAVMPRDVQLQMFQRSFSTKGVGRGIGTYSMKLLTERYLKGKITFESAEGKGTTFTATLPVRP